MRKHKTKLHIKLISFGLLLTVLLFGALSHTTRAANSRYSGSIDESTVIAGRLYAGFCVQPTLDEIHQTYNYKPLISVSSSHGITFRTLGGNGYDIDGKTILDGIEEACRTYYGSKYATQGTFFATKVGGVTEGVETCAVMTKDTGECVWKDKWGSNWGGTSGAQRWRTFTISTDISVDEAQTSTQFWVMGMIHYDRNYSGLNDWVYAKKIGFCRKSADCDKTDAEGKNADGLVNSAPSGGWTLQRMSGSVNPPYRIYSSWTYPNRDYHLTMTMNNKKLIDGIIDGSIAVNSEDFRNKIKNGEDATGTAYLYTHRCMNASFNQNGACGVGRLDLTVSIKRDKPKKTTFDGSVTASVGNCSKSECEVSTKKSTISFVYQMKRKNDGPDDKNATNDWAAYYHSDLKGNISTNAGATGSVTYSKNSSLAALSNSPQTVEVTLDPGKSATVCQKLTFREEVVFDASHPNGTVNTNSNLIERSDCMTVKRRNNVHTFNGKTTYEVENLSPTTTGGKRYNTDAATAKVTFNYSFCRTDEVEPNPAKGYWYTYHDNSTINKNTTATESGTNSFDEKGCVNKDSPDVRNVTLKVGDNKICGAIGWLKSVDEAGTTGDWDHDQVCVTIHKYAWYALEGRVVATTNATAKDSYYWTDTNKATLQFSHEFKTSSTVAIMPKFKTSKGANLGNDFNIQLDYAQGDAISSTDGWTPRLTSPATATEVTVPKDNGDTFCEYLNFYNRVREDSKDYKNITDVDPKATSAEACVKLRRYKTTFTGSTVVYYNNIKTNRAGDTITIEAGDHEDQYPVEIPITFVHTVTRNNDTYGSPNKKKSTITTSIDGTNGYRHNDTQSDPHGTARTTANTTNVETKGLAAGESDSHTDSFTIKLYPEQVITLCQTLTYRNEIQGADNISDATAEKTCITIKMTKATCMEGETFGIDKASNYLRGYIYKYDADQNKFVLNGDSGPLYQGTGHNVIAWAKPDDEIQFRYKGCAGGELARQYNYSTTQTSYTVESEEGYLFGRKIGWSGGTDTDKNKTTNYKDTSTTYSNASNDPGTGPFENSSFTVDFTSPSGDGGSNGRLYSCDKSGLGNTDNAYFIPALTGVNNNCKSSQVGRFSDLGQVIRQTTTWTDIQYSSSKPVTNHNGVNAELNLYVKVPYNYSTVVKPTGDGGFIIPGNEHRENILFSVKDRTNSSVDDKYSTATKPTKYKLIEIIIDSDYAPQLPEGVSSASYFSGLVNKDEYFEDTTGTKDLDSTLGVCTDSKRFQNGTRMYECDTKVEGSSPRYESGSNGISLIGNGGYKTTIPHDAEPGTKFCYIAAVWPSDSHKPIDSGNGYILDENIDDTDNDNYALTTNGYFWHVSGATCYTVAKRPSIAVLGGDSYAQNYISARVQKYPLTASSEDRTYGSWTEYAAIAGNNIKGYASGASLWGGSDIINDDSVTRTCAFSSYTFANASCNNSQGSLGSLNIDLTSSSNPENIAGQIKTRYTRSGVGKVTPVGDATWIQNSGTCNLVAKPNDTYEYSASGVDSDNFACIGDAGAKYTHVTNTGVKTAYLYSGNDSSPICLDKGSEDSNAITVVHSDGTLVIGSNIVYGSSSAQYPGEAKENGCYPNVYNGLNELQQSILIAKKIVIRDRVTHIDSWLIADEIVTCDPNNDWLGKVTVSQINSKNCDKQLNLNGPVMTKTLSLFRTHGAGFVNGTALLASPAEVFNMGSETYLWAFNQAQRYSQATTTYARELAPRY